MYLKRRQRRLMEMPWKGRMVRLQQQLAPKRKGRRGREREENKLRKKETKNAGLFVRHQTSAISNPILIYAYITALTSSSDLRLGACAAAWSRSFSTSRNKLSNSACSAALPAFNPVILAEFTVSRSLKNSICSFHCDDIVYDSVTEGNVVDCRICYDSKNDDGDMIDDDVDNNGNNDDDNCVWCVLTDAPRLEWMTWIRKIQLSVSAWMTRNLRSQPYRHPCHLAHRSPPQAPSSRLP